MAVFKGGRDRDDHFVGTAASDTFLFAPVDLTNGDTLLGSAGIDTLQFTAAGTITADQLANVSGIERIRLADGANSLTLTNALVATATGHRVSIRSLAGSDLIDASALTSGNAVDILAGTGNDTMRGGTGADVFDFAGGTVTAGDTVTGGLGVDTVRFGDQAVISADMLANVSQVEVLRLGETGTKLSLTALVMRTTYTLDVFGGAGADTVNLTQMVTDGVQGQLRIDAGAGDDAIRSDADRPSFYYVYAIIDGGAGADAIDLTNLSYVSVIYDGMDRRALTSGGTLIVNGGADLDLTRAKDQSLNDTAVLQGFAVVDASASTAAVHAVGGSSNILVGSAGDDVLIGGGTMTGGKGKDTILSDGAATVRLAVGDFVAGETIVVHGGTLDVVGSIDFTIGHVAGFATIGAHLAPGRQSALVQMDSDLFAGPRPVYADKGVTVRVLVDDTIAHSFYQDAGYGTLEFLGNAADNIISAAIGVIRGGDGNDVLWSEQDVYGQGGDDRIGYSEFGATLLGGDGSDTLTSLESTYQIGLTIDLSKRDQTIGDATIVGGFENVDLSLGNAGATNIYGSTAANVLVGERGDDVILGRAGDDVIDGGAGIDTLIGGLGADVFRWLDRVGNYGGDHVIDFKIGEDQLAFDQGLYDVTGAFDRILVTAGTRVDIEGVDLLVYTGGRINETSDVADLLNGEIGGSTKEGIFLAVRDNSGDTILYHSTQSAGGDFWDVAQIADLGKVDPTQLTLSDFAFI